MITVNWASGPRRSIFRTCICPVYSLIIIIKKVLKKLLCMKLLIAKKALAKGQSPPQELEVRSHSGLYLLFYFLKLNLFKIHTTLFVQSCPISRTSNFVHICQTYAEYCGPQLCYGLFWSFKLFGFINWKYKQTNKSFSSFCDNVVRYGRFI